MKQSALIPTWVVGVSEELAAQQIKNMIGQYLDAKLKTQFKAIPMIREKTENTLLRVVNSLGVQSGDDKPTLIWLVQQINNKSIALDTFEEDGEQIAATLKSYYKYRRELKKLPEYNYSSLKTAVRSIEGKSEGGPGTLTDVLAKPYAQSGDLKMYEVTDVAIANEFGKGTHWCTQGKSQAEHYLSQGPLYVVLKNGKRYAQIHFPSGSFMDVTDNRLSPDMVDEIKSAFPEQLDALAKKEDNSWNVVWEIKPSYIKKADFIRNKTRDEHEPRDYVSFSPEEMGNLLEETFGGRQCLYPHGFKLEYNKEALIITTTNGLRSFYGCINRNIKTVNIRGYSQPRRPEDEMKMTADQIDNILQYGWEEDIDSFVMKDGFADLWSDDNKKLLCKLAGITIPKSDATNKLFEALKANEDVYNEIAEVYKDQLEDLIESRIKDNIENALQYAGFYSIDNNEYGNTIHFKSIEKICAIASVINDDIEKFDNLFGSEDDYDDDEDEPVFNVELDIERDELPYRPYDDEFNEAVEGILTKAIKAKKPKSTRAKKSIQEHVFDKYMNQIEV